LQVGAVYLPAQHRDLVAQHRDLVAQHQEFDVLGSAVAGELGQHLQHLTVRAKDALWLRPRASVAVTVMASASVGAAGAAAARRSGVPGAYR
jgi:hypothetical protein